MKRSIVGLPFFLTASTPSLGQLPVCRLFGIIGVPLSGCWVGGQGKEELPCLLSICRWSSLPNMLGIMAGSLYRSARFCQNMSGQFASGLNWLEQSESWLFSIWQLTANCEVAILFVSKFRTSLQPVRSRSVSLSCKARRVSLFVSRSPRARGNH